RALLRPAQLSTGECQRVAVARALADDPAILLADEPTASLDADNGQAVLELLSRLVRERGTTLVVVTHDSRIFPFADRILRLQDGRLTADYKPSEVPVSVPGELLVCLRTFIDKWQSPPRVPEDYAEAVRACG